MKQSVTILAHIVVGNFKERLFYMQVEKRVNEHYPKQDFGFIDDEYWKPVIVHGVTIDKYSVSNYGNVIGPHNKKLKWVKNGGNKYSQYPAVSLSCDPESLADSGYDYVPDRTRISRTKSFNVVSNAHVLVANVFLPLDDNIPQELQEYIEIDGRPKHLWSLLPDHTKAWLRSLLHVDHIDNDRGNPHVSNLRFISPRANNSYVKKKALEGSCQ